MRRALHLAERQFATLFEMHPDPVFMLDLDGNFTGANRAAERLTGRPAESLRDECFLDVLLPGAAMDVSEGFQKALQGEAVQLSTTIQHVKGRAIELEITGLPIVVDDEVVGMYGIATDVTSRNQMARDLRRAQMVAEQASEAKSFFLTNVSHELRTPLTVLLGNFEMLEDTELRDDQRFFVDAMHRSGERLLGLVTDILDYSRLEQGSLKLVSHPFDLRAVVGEVVALVRPGAERKGLYFVCEVDDSVPASVSGDSARLTQVLAGLLDNAVKFTEMGVVRVGVSVPPTAVEESDGRLPLHIEVQDSGIGIAEHDLERIFDPFIQVDGSATRRFEGAGLGLACCRQLVAMMGGRLSVESMAGYGTTFGFTVELERDAPAPWRA